MRWQPFTALLLSALAVASGAPARVAAQGMDTFGMGSRSTSLGGAVTADVSDFSAAFYNPAGIVRDGRLELSVGYFRVAPDLEVDGRDSNVDGIGGTVFGLNVPGRVGDFRFAFGIGGHLPDARISRTRSLPRQQPRWELYDNRPHRTFLAANAAIRPFDWLLIGGGIGFMATSNNQLEARGGLDLSSPESGSRVEHQVSFDLTAIRYPQFGVQITPNDQWSFGAVYRGEYALGSDLTAEVVADITGVGDPIPAYLYLETSSINTFNPRQVSVGASYRPVPSLRIGVDVTWVDWSDYRSPIGRSDVFLTIDVPPDLADLIDVPDSIDSTDFIPAEFNDRFVPRIGVEATLLEEEDLSLVGRLGYFFESTPVPDQTGITNLIDNDRHAVNAGVGLSIGGLEPLVTGGLTVDAHFQWSIIPERTIRKASLVDTIGDYRGRGQLFGAGATVGLEFE